MHKNLILLLLISFTTSVTFAFDYMGTFQSDDKFELISHDGKSYQCLIKSITFDEFNSNGHHILRISPAELLCDSLHPKGSAFISFLPGHTFFVDAAFPGCKGKFSGSNVDMDPLKACLEFYPFDVEKNRRSGTGRGVAKNKSFKFLTSRPASSFSSEILVIDLNPNPYEFIYSNYVFAQEVEGLGAKKVIKQGLINVPLTRISY